MKVVIIEDEILLRETNRMLLKTNFPHMEIVGEAGSVEEAVRVLKITKPDLVLMDIELAGGNCFQVLQACKPYAFKVVFITAFNQFAIKAIKFSAIDYILKPVNEFEFCNAINEAIKYNKHDEHFLQASHFEQQYIYKKPPHKLLLRTSDSLYLADTKDVVYCRSDNSYTSFFLLNGQEIIVSKSMKEYEELLSEYNFIRPHQSFLINLDHVEKVDKNDGGFIIMKNQKEIPISTRRKQAVLARLEQI